MIDLNLTKEHLRIDGNDEDAYLISLIDAATDYVTAITKVPNDATAPKRYDHLCLLLIGHWYANREAVSEGNLQKIPYGVASLMHTLRPVSGLIGIEGQAPATTPDANTVIWVAQ
ncbi:head-tail connector protein [Paracoccus sp. (in: a-proteobacteria)]|uniref:head-tail connector protein n=1 Tax=Paracoccus sp. TaxID=267 RepID=UPI0040581A48